MRCHSADVGVYPTTISISQIHFILSFASQQVTWGGEQTCRWYLSRRESALFVYFSWLHSRTPLLLAHWSSIVTCTLKPFCRGICETIDAISAVFNFETFLNLMSAFGGYQGELYWFGRSLSLVEMASSSIPFLLSDCERHIGLYLHLQQWHAMRLDGCKRFRWLFVEDNVAHSLPIERHIRQSSNWTA